MFDQEEKREAARRAAAEAAWEEALIELAEHLATYLPVQADWQTTYTFQSAVKVARVDQYWRGGDAVPALEYLLRQVIERERGRVGHVMETIVEQAIFHRDRSGMPLARVELDELNDLLKRVGFEVPRLMDPKFRHKLADVRMDEAQRENRKRKLLETSKRDFVTLAKERGPEDAAAMLVVLLRRLLKMGGIKPTTRFETYRDLARGAFPLDFHTISLEATSRPPLDAAHLERFANDLPEGVQTLGLLISVNGFMPDAVHMAAMDTAPRYMMMDGAHIYRVLSGEVEFPALCRRLVTYVAREATPYVPVDDLLART